MSPQTVVPKTVKIVATINAVDAIFLKYCDTLGLGSILIGHFPEALN